MSSPMRHRLLLFTHNCFDFLLSNDINSRTFITFCFCECHTLKRKMCLFKKKQAHENSTHSGIKHNKRKMSSHKNISICITNNPIENRSQNSSDFLYLNFLKNIDILIIFQIFKTSFFSIK